MGKRSDSMETLDFALAVVQRIPSNGFVSTSEIKKQLDAMGLKRDVRSVQRMLDGLHTRYPEIERDESSKPYGYRWSKGSKGLSIPNLSLEQSMVLQLAEQYLKNLLPANIMQSMEGFFYQARRNLSVEDDSNQLQRQWAHKVRVVATNQPLLPPKIADSVLEAVSQSLYHNQYLYVDYRNAKGKASQAKVMPLGLAQQGPRLYLVCRFEGYDNERSLAVHRISHAEVSGLAFVRPASFDLEKYDADGRFGFGEGQLVRLSFVITQEAGQHLLESPLAKDQRAQELPDGRLAISATVVDTAMLQWWLRGFGDAVSQVQLEPVQ